jgi:hypothetical protein
MRDIERVADVAAVTTFALVVRPVVQRLPVRTRTRMGIGVV